MGLINIKERILALQAKEIIDAPGKIPDTDNLIYEIGTHQEQIFDQPIAGPKAENTPNKYTRIINTIKTNKEGIKNYKKRKKQTTKELQNILYPKTKTVLSKDIYFCKNPKTTSLNFLIANGLLPIFQLKHVYSAEQRKRLYHISS